MNSELADSERSVIVEQVTNGVSVRMAVLYLLLGGSDLLFSSAGIGKKHDGIGISRVLLED